MKLKKITMSLGLFTLLLAGCNNTKDYNAANCKFDIQQNLDTKDYTEAIKLLDNECSDKLTNEVKNINYGFAYLGKSGLDFYEVIKTMSNGNTDLTSLVNDFSNKTTDDSLSYLITSTEYFTKDKNIDCSIDTNNYFNKDICLYSGITELLKTTVLLDTLTNNITDFQNNSRPLDMIANSCAMEYTLTNVCTASVVDNYYEASPITFVNNKTYIPFISEIGGVKYTQLLNDNGTQKNVILTKGNCDLSFNSCDITKDTECYPCPLSKSGDDIQTLDVLLDSVTNGINNLNNITSDKDISASIDKIKTEISGNNQGDITKEDIVNYLQNN